MTDTNSSDPGEEMRRKATALLRYANRVGLDYHTSAGVLGGNSELEILRTKEDELYSMAEQVLDVLPTLCEQIEKLSELCAELFTQKTELQILSRDLAASLRSNPNATNT